MNAELGQSPASHCDIPHSAFLIQHLFQDSKFFSNLHKRGDALVEVLTLVGGAHLYADAGLALRHHRIVESGDEDAFFLQLGGELLRQRGAYTSTFAFLRRLFNTPYSIMGTSGFLISSLEIAY